jgi:hypothetical protein
MITIDYGVTLNLEEAPIPFNQLRNTQPGEPYWYQRQRTNILHRMEQDLEGDLYECDPSVKRVVIDHSCWVECWFETDDIAQIQVLAEAVRDRVQTCIDNIIAEYPSRLKKFHDDLLADGEEIPADVYQP